MGIFDNAPPGAAEALLDAAMTDGKRQVDEEKAAAAAGEQRQEQDGRSWEDDPWNKPGAVNTEQPAPDPNADPWQRFKGLRGHALDTPANESLYHIPIEVLDAQVKDFGVAADQSRLPRDVAQGFVELYAAEAREDQTRAGQNGFNPESTVNELYRTLGVDETHEHLGRIEKYVNARPALAAYLDSTGLGNSPVVLQMLAVVAETPDIVTPAGAKSFIDKINGDMKHPYWKRDARGHKHALVAAKIAYQFLKD